MKKKPIQKTTPKRKGGAKVRRVTVTFYPEKKLRDQLICHYIDSLGISTSEAVSGILLECALQHAREMANEVHGLAEGRIKYLTLAELLAILTGEWAGEKVVKPVVIETACIPQNYQTNRGLPNTNRGLPNEGDSDYSIDDL